MPWHTKRKNSCLLLVFYDLLLLSVWRTVSSHSLSEDIEPDTSLVEVVEGFNASLPCAIHSPPQYDVPVLTLWYIEDQETPVYSYDQREPRRSFSWSEESVFGGRAKFLPREHPPVLMLTNVTVQDHKLYRCRVDYHKSNSRQAWVRLTVIVPPSGIKIIPQISPVVLGQRNDVICSATGGSPLAKVEWIQEGQIVDSTSTPNDERDASYNSLEVRATRKDLSESFTCRAYNNKYTPMLQATYRRNVTCGPLSVEIVPEEKPIVAGRMVKLICTVVGSHPPALVTWFQQGQQVTPLHTQVQERDNVTISTLLLRVTRDHHDRQMICRADHPILPLSTLEDIYTLDVLYKPNVSLSLGRSLDFQTLREGNDIFFECHVDSNPPPYKVTWHHQNEELFHNVSAGVLVSESTLALQHVQRHRSGDYKCIASNVEGDSESNVVSINIKYSPRCAVSPSLRGVALFELTNITCEVDADPFNVSFKWTFHNSVRRDQSQVVSGRRYTQEGLKSTLSYTPMSERDYGTLLCFATNDVGPQKEPCSFTIISAGPPEEVSNCTAGNITSHSASINCLPGFDGGLPQKFLLQIWETKDDQLVLNMTSQTPTFKAKPLDPGNTYRAKVVSFNSRGRSKPSKFIILTLKKAEMRKSLPSMVPPSPPMFIMGVVGGIIAVTGALVIAILCWVRKKMKHPAHRDILHAQVILKENNPDLISVEASGEGSHIRENGSSQDILAKGFSAEASYQRYEEDDASMYGSFPSKTGADRGHLSYASPLLPEGSGDGRGYSSTGSSGVEGGGRGGGGGCRLDDEYGEEGPLEGSRGGGGGGGLDVSYIRGAKALEGRRRDVGGALGVVVGSGRELLSEEATSLITEEDIDLGRQMTVRLFSGGMTPEASL